MRRNSRSRRGREPWPAFYLITCALAAAAIVSVLALDFINWTTGERSYLFKTRPRKTAAAAVKAEPPEAEAAAKPASKPAAKPTARPPAKAAARVQPPPARRSVRGEVALIIDDMGDNPEALDVVIGLKQAVTVSVLPYSRLAEETARVAHDNNLEVLVHVPLESLNNHDPAADKSGMILASMPPGEIVQALENALARVPYADGVNNHMGSRFTSDGDLMRTLLEPVKERGLFFVDSRTSAQTVAYGEALRMGIPSVERDVFLDADADRSMIKSRLVELFRTAQRKGRAVGICHPFPETLRVLKASFAEFADYGLEVVPVSRLVHK